MKDKDIKTEKYSTENNFIEEKSKTVDQLSEETFEKQNHANDGDVSTFGLPKRCMRICVTSKHDKLPCDITGSCFDKYGYMHAADNANKLVKSLNVSDCLLISVCMVEEEPWDITFVEDEDLVATTIPSTGKIQFFTLLQSGDLSKGRAIRVGVQCRGIMYSRGCLIVSYGHSRSTIIGKIQIMHTNGVLLHTFSEDKCGNKLFNYPSHLALSRDHNTIYVTDFAKCSILSLQIDGSVNAVFKSDKIKDPRGLAVGAGDVLYVCDFYSNCVHMLSKDLKKCELFAGKNDGVTSPRSVAVINDNNDLFVTMFYKRFIAKFDGCI